MFIAIIFIKKKLSKFSFHLTSLGHFFPIYKIPLPSFEYVKYHRCVFYLKCIFNRLHKLFLSPKRRWIHQSDSSLTNHDAEIIEVDQELIMIRIKLGHNFEYFHNHFVICKSLECLQHLLRRVASDCYIVQVCQVSPSLTVLNILLPVGHNLQLICDVIG